LKQAEFIWPYQLCQRGSSADAREGELNLKSLFFAKFAAFLSELAVKSFSVASERKPWEGNADHSSKNFLL